MAAQLADEQNRTPRISRNIDHVVNELIELISKDYILYYFEHLMGSESSIDEVKMGLKRDFWTIINNFSERLAKIDQVKLVSTDVVRKITSHFERIRISQESSQIFAISPHLNAPWLRLKPLVKVETM